MKKDIGWIAIIGWVLAFGFMIMCLLLTITVREDRKDLRWRDEVIDDMSAEVDMCRMQIEGIAPALEACEADNEFLAAENKMIGAANASINEYFTSIVIGRDMATIRVTTAYELLNALTSTIGDDDSVARYQKILDNIELIADPTLDNMMDGWMLNADEDESMLMLLEIIKYLLLDAEHHLLPR